MDISILNKEFNQEERYKSYDYIEDFISNNVKDWRKTPDTDMIERIFSKDIHNLSDIEFAFLLCHSGYIPEFYEHDSSQETLYSKLIESLVCEWAKRIGFTESFLQKQKSNKEDITIKKRDKVIVCDAKSFRLGRSQAAPNVKDIIKKAAHESWLNAYDKGSRVGGLVTFPSLHECQKSSEAYKYFTEGNPAIMLLFYEQMSFMLLNKYTADDVVSFMTDYAKIFSVSSEKKDIYVNGLYDQLFAKKKDEYTKFSKLFSSIIKEKVSHTIERIDSHLSESKSTIENEIEKMDAKAVKKIAIDASFHKSCNQLMKQRDNILKFRPHN